MSDKVYLKAWEAAWAGDIDWVADDIRAVLVDVASYTINPSTHEFLSDITGGARAATTANLTSGKTTTLGAIDIANFAFASVPTGPPCEAVVFYKWTGSDATSRLIVYRDTAVSGLPVTPNGGDINILFSTVIFNHANP
jgi:hypothetical protein